MEIPHIPGFEARPYRGKSDHAGMAEVINASNRAAGIDEVTSAGQISADYRHLTNCDPLEDMLMVEDADGLVGYTRCTWWDVEGGARTHAVFAHVHPRSRGQEIERILLEWSERRNAEIASTQETQQPRVYESWAGQRTQPERCRLLEEMGYRAVTYGADMVRPHLDAIPDAPLPQGVEIRPVAEEHLRAIWEADKDAFRDHWGDRSPTEEDWEAFLDFPHRDEKLWKVAWHGDQVVGQVRSFIKEEENREFGRARGYTEFISTHREWRRRGIARGLICASLRELRARGMTEAALGVHTENPTGAFRLYESLGFEVTDLYTTYHKAF